VQVDNLNKGGGAILSRGRSNFELEGRALRNKGRHFGVGGEAIRHMRKVSWGAGTMF
jgi:hypothetical protein